MTQQAPPPPTPDPFSTPIVYPVPEADLRVLRDVPYRTEGQLRLLADVYQPGQLTDRDRRPAVVFIHGGPIPATFSPKEWRMFKDYGRLMAASGFVGITFNHRLNAPTDYTTAEGDLAALLDFIGAHAAEWKVDPDRIILWCFSGGGPLLTVAMDPARRGVRGIIAYYCFLDFASSGRPELQSVPREILDRISPLAHLRKRGSPCAPVLLARAGKDDPGLNASIRAFFDEALAQGVAVELLNHPTGEHSFDARNNDDRSREIIGRTLAFIRARVA